MMEREKMVDMTFSIRMAYLFKSSVTLSQRQIRYGHWLHLIHWSTKRFSIHRYTATTLDTNQTLPGLITGILF